MLLPSFITQGIPYDYCSVMHYQSFANSKNGSLTMVPKSSIVPPDILGGEKIPTPNDYLHVNLLYCVGNRNMHKHVTIQIYIARLMLNFAYY